MIKLYKGPSIDAAYQVSIHLAKRFQIRREEAILVSDWLISKKSSPLKPLCQMNQNLIGSILGRSKTFNQCEKNLTCSILSLYSYISRIIDMHTNRGS
jgi:hypothetical protein